MLPRASKSPEVPIVWLPVYWMLAQFRLRPGMQAPAMFPSIAAMQPVQHWPVPMTAVSLQVAVKGSAQLVKPPGNEVQGAKGSSEQTPSVQGVARPLAEPLADAQAVTPSWQKPAVAVLSVTNMHMQ